MCFECSKGCLELGYGNCVIETVKTQREIMEFWRAGSTLFSYHSILYTTLGHSTASPNTLNENTKRPSANAAVAAGGAAGA
jgi:hypothetical protein